MNKTIEDCKQEVYASLMDVLREIILRDSEEINGFNFSWLEGDDGEVSGGQLDINYSDYVEPRSTINWDFVPTKGGYEVHTFT